MNQSERDELRRDLEAAGCPWLATHAVWCGPDHARELRSLLRREKIRRYEEAINWAIDNYDALPPELQSLVHKLGRLLACDTIDAEVPE